MGDVIPIRDTKQALDDAISDHFATVCGGAIVNGYVLQIAGESMEDMDLNQWAALRETADGQSFVMTLGLVAYATRSLEVSMSERADD
jgi:hypothetical protein